MGKFIVRQDEPNEPNEQGLEVVWFVWFVHALRNAFKPDLVHFVWFVWFVHKKETHPQLSAAYRIDARNKNDAFHDTVKKSDYT